MSEQYHYTECGLDSVYLVNGVSFVDGKMTIHDIDGLHRMIGQWLVTTRKKLSGEEIRFLRHEMELSQSSLARLLGVSEQSVLRWERRRKERENGNPAAERALRLLYLEQSTGNTSIAEALEAIADIEDELDRLGAFDFSDSEGWHEDEAA